MADTSPGSRRRVLLSPLPFALWQQTMELTIPDQPCATLGTTDARFQLFGERRKDGRSSKELIRATDFDNSMLNRVGFNPKTKVLSVERN